MEIENIIIIYKNQMTIKKIIPSFLEGVVKKNVYLFLIIFFLLFVLGFKYMMNNNETKEDEQGPKNHNFDIYGKFHLYIIIIYTII
jgi:hypothetical protein